MNTFSYTLIPWLMQGAFAIPEGNAPKIMAYGIHDDVQALQLSPPLLARSATRSFCPSTGHQEICLLGLDGPGQTFPAAPGLHATEGDLDLGATMMYYDHRYVPLQNRILAVKPFWTRLRTQRLSAWHKLLAIRQASFVLRTAPRSPFWVCINDGLPQTPFPDHARLEV